MEGIKLVLNYAFCGKRSHDEWYVASGCGCMCPRMCPKFLQLVARSSVPHLRLQLLEEVLAYCQFANDAGTNDRLSMMTPTAIAHARSMILAGMLMFMASGENPV